MPGSIAVWLNGHEFLNERDRLFDASDNRSPAFYYTEPFSVLKEYLSAHGYELTTIDKLQGEVADALVIVDLPAQRSTLDHIRKSCPARRHVLIVMESPIGRAHMFCPRNFREFDAVLTYDSQACDGSTVFHYRLPVLSKTLLMSNALPEAASIGFSERRVLAVLNANRYRDWFSWRGSPVTPVFRGWAICHSTTKKLLVADGYEKRRQFIKQADRSLADGLDIYGNGWSGEPKTTWHRFIAPRAYSCARGGWPERSDLLFRRYKFGLAFENCITNLGYVSEKIFLPMLGGAVPVYLGEEHISDYVPASAFIDARRYHSYDELCETLRDMPEPTWQNIRTEGLKFLRSSGVQKFTVPQMAEALLSAFQALKL